MFIMGCPFNILQHCNKTSWGSTQSCLTRYLSCSTSLFGFLVQGHYWYQWLYMEHPFIRYFGLYCHYPAFVVYSRSHLFGWNWFPTIRWLTWPMAILLRPIYSSIRSFRCARIICACGITCMRSIRLHASICSSNHPFAYQNVCLSSPIRLSWDTCPSTSLSLSSCPI